MDLLQRAGHIIAISIYFERIIRMLIFLKENKQYIEEINKGIYSDGCNLNYERYLDLYPNFNEKLIKKFSESFNNEIKEIDKREKQDIIHILNIIRSIRDILCHAQYHRSTNIISMKPKEHRRKDMIKYLNIKDNTNDKRITKEISEEYYEFIKNPLEWLDSKGLYSISENMGLNYLYLRG